jgi:glucose dehydrogenase
MAMCMSKLAQALIATALTVGAATVITGGQQSKTQPGEWPYVFGDKGSRKYSPLDQINRDNVKNLRILWRRPSVDQELKKLFPDVSPSNNLRSTPIMVDGVLYASDGIGLVEAFDPGTGKTLWVQHPIPEQGKAGTATRGVGFWKSGDERRVLSIRGEYLFSIDARNGAPDRAFGTDGRVNLHRNDSRAKAYRWSSGPLVVGDIVVVAGTGGGTADYGPEKAAAPEDVRGYDVRTGRLVWTFHVMPRAGEPGVETWGDNSSSMVGAMGSWAPLTADEETGYVYVPLTAPANAFYGGHRPGQNLYANSLVCLDGKTGKRVWHYQLIHHDLWDYDLPTSPVLADITVNGRRIKAVMAVAKTPYLFVFDRTTGAPVWPIEERPVPQSTTPGEKSWPTQPFPTKPAAFDRVGLTTSDLIDFTPELRAEALQIAKQYKYGPLFTPPSIRDSGPGGTKGTISLPAANGGPNWNGPAFDPDTGLVYVPSVTNPFVDDLILPVNQTANTERYVHGPSQQPGEKPLEQRPEQMELLGPRGLPLTKPPYGRITAIDLNRGEHVWMVPNGDGPRNHPLLKPLNLPPLGQPGRAVPMVTKTLLFMGEGSDIMASIFPGGGGNKFRAYDKATGKVIWETELPGGTTAGPMTYLSKGKQFIVVPVGDKAHAGEWVALGLP